MKPPIKKTLLGLEKAHVDENLMHALAYHPSSMYYLSWKVQIELYCEVFNVSTTLFAFMYYIISFFSSSFLKRLTWIMKVL